MMRGWQQIVVVVALAAGCGDNNDRPPPDAPPDGSGQSQLERGQYIANVLANCTFCHTPLRSDGTRDQDKLLSGVDCFADIDSATFLDNGNHIGCISTRNLTPDATGLAGKTDEQIKNAFRNGVRTDGKKLAPLMPFWIFHNMSDADADAVVAYLRSIPPVAHTVKPNEPPWGCGSVDDPPPANFNCNKEVDANLPPFTYNDGGIPQPPFIFPELLPMPRGGANNQSAMRGRYLSSMAGLCVDCHSPTLSEDFVNDLPGVLTVNQSMFYGGGRIFPKEQLGLVAPGFSYPAFIVTRNLTSDMTGLKDWSRDQIKNAIAVGKDRDGKAVCAATHGGVISPYAALLDQDLEDIVEYIYNLPPVVNDTAAKFCPAPPLVNGPETGNQCGNGVDDDGDTIPDDGCLCGNCQGPAVQ
jgi:mono/diheme cytochrome c family protein